VSFVANPRRDAYSTIAGFLYQVDTTIVRWLNLQSSEILELERGEDIDIIRQEFSGGTVDETRLLEQLKRRAGSITLRSLEVLESICNFCEHRRTNPSLRLRFRYVSTGLAGKEERWNLRQNGIDTWEAIRKGQLPDVDKEQALVAIASLLANSRKPDRIRAQAWLCLQELLSGGNSALSELIENFEWSLGAGDLAALEEQIKSALMNSGHAADPIVAQTILDRLIVFVFKLLSTAGIKRLTVGELSEQLTASPLAGPDQAILGALRAGLAQVESRLKEVEDRVDRVTENLSVLTKSVSDRFAGQQQIQSIAVRSIALSLDFPALAQPIISRSEPVRTLVNLLQAKTLINIFGEPGSGKTQLALLLAQQYAGRKVWLNIERGHTEEQACIAIDAMLSEVANVQPQLIRQAWYRSAAAQLGTVLIVIDDVPQTITGGTLARRLRLLLDALSAFGGKLVTVGYYPLPRSLTDIDGVSEFNAPRLTEIEIQELLAAYGAPEQLAASLVDLIATTTRRLPILVTAIARYLSEQRWEFDWNQFEAMLRGEFAKSARSDAKALIELTVPDSYTRELLYRMTLTIGGFTRATAGRLGDIPPAIPLSREKLDRLVGLWVQPFVGEKLWLSPLIDSSLAAYLPPETQKRVHVLLGAEILSKRVLEPIDVITCVHHLSAADAMNQAALVVIQALLILDESKITDDVGISRLWPSGPLPSTIDIDLRLYLRALQIGAQSETGQTNLLMIDEVDQLIVEAGEQSWGAAMATSGLAIRFCRKYPSLSNRYILPALRGLTAAILPGGNQIPRTGPGLEGLLWVTAVSASSDADVESWIATVRQLTPSQIEAVSRSELAEDNATILCDGIWLREYRLRDSERDWGRVERMIKKLEELASEKGLSVLEAAAVRTRIMILAEWRHDIEAAVQLAESALQALEKESDRFLIIEVTGRQLSYANRPSEAIAWLERARSLPVTGHPLWRRNVLITLAEEVGKTDAHRAVEYTQEALDLSRRQDWSILRIVEASAEHSLALWLAGERNAAFVTLQEAAIGLFRGKSDQAEWTKLFLAFFELATYLSSVALNGTPPPNWQNVTPQVGRFLGLDNVDVTRFLQEQEDFLRIRMAMFAEGVGDTTAAGSWIDEVFSVATLPDAQNVTSAFAYLGIGPALQNEDFLKAIHLGLKYAAVVPTGNPSSQLGGSQADLALRTGLIKGLVPVALKLATLALRGSNVANAVDSTAHTLTIQGYRIVGSAVQDLLADGKTGAELHEHGRAEMARGSYAAGMILILASSMRSSLEQALHSHIWLARQLENAFERVPSLVRHVEVPFFQAFWTQAVAQQGQKFRTSSAYTSRSIADAVNHPDQAGIKQLFRAMAFCLGTDLTEDAKQWVEDR
jgi:hypothetical protein